MVPLLAFREYMYSMLSTPDICCSIGVATDCSMVSASAPGYVAFTTICGSAMLGNCAVGRLSIATTPMITIRMEITMATIGRLMKNLAMDHRKVEPPFNEDVRSHGSAAVNASPPLCPRTSLEGCLVQRPAD